MQNTITHYQTSFRILDHDDKGMFRLKSSVYGWISNKEKDRIIKNDKKSFFFRCNWQNLFSTYSNVTTMSFLSDTGDAWAVRYRENDSERRTWISDIGIKKEGHTIIVSIRISFAWNNEYLGNHLKFPDPSIPRIVRYILNDTNNNVFCGRPEFKLYEIPIPFLEPGKGKVLCDFIQAPDRRYPLIVFNDDSTSHVQEACKLAKELAGKCLVAIIANNQELAEEIKTFLPKDYRIGFGQFRVFFPFNKRKNSFERHRWYNIQSEEYPSQRQGLINGLLRNHTIIEHGAVENLEEIRRLIARQELVKLKVESPDQQKQLDEFFKEHEQVVADRDAFKQESETYVCDIDRLEDELRQEKWKCKDFQHRLDLIDNYTPVDFSELMPTLPSNLEEVSKAARSFFTNLIITEQALNSSRFYNQCKSINETWEILYHMNNTLYRLKFKEAEKDLERAFKNATGYELGMSEGRNTKRDNQLMNLRIIRIENKEYDITPHIKYSNNEPKSVRIYFAFDEETKKIIVGHIGKHIPNATTKTI